MKLCVIIWEYFRLYVRMSEYMKLYKKIIGDNILYVRVCEIIWKYTGVSEGVIVTFQSLRVGRSEWGY